MVGLFGGDYGCFFTAICTCLNVNKVQQADPDRRFLTFLMFQSLKSSFEFEHIEILTLSLNERVKTIIPS